MINIHIIGDGSYLYAVKTLLEINQDQFSDGIEVTCFGEHYLNPSYVRKFSVHLTMEDIIRKADIVICTNPIYEHEKLVMLCKEYHKPLLCSFELEEKVTNATSIVMDNINLQTAATDLWIKRLLDVTENLHEIEHYIGVSKTSDTGDNALPGLTMDEYQQATEGVYGQPNLIKLQNQYYFASEMDDWKSGDVQISTYWINDSDRIDGSKISLETNTIFHTVITAYDDKLEQVQVKHSHTMIPNRRTLSSWNYANACVMASFVYMWHKDFIPKICTDYMELDHNTFSDNIFGRIFRIA